MPTDDNDHEITIHGGGQLTKYHFTTTGWVEGGDRWDATEGKHVAGMVGPSADTYQYSGDIIDFGGTNLDAATIELDDVEIAAELLPMSRLDIYAPNDRGFYQFSTQGKAIRTSDEPIDNVFGDGVKIRGTAGAGGHEVYRFSGTLDGFKCTTDMQIWVDGLDKGVIQGAPFGTVPERWK